MTEERTRVLSMLASGKVTVEQANQLLEKLGEQPEPRDETGLEESLDQAEELDETEGPMFGDFTFSQVLQLGVAGIDPSFIEQVRAAGLTDLSFDQIVHMGMVGVDPSFVVAARASGVEGLTFDQIVHLGVVGVDPSFIKKVRAAGLTDLSFDQIVQLGVTGVDPAFLMQFRTPATQRLE